jgi:NAD(P)-dependent dehydrogenase (short-subunit alcohol dehydrogenase family)
MSGVRMSKVLPVTGALSGIGLEIARLFTKARDLVANLNVHPPEDEESGATWMNYDASNWLGLTRRLPAHRTNQAGLRKRDAAFVAVHPTSICLASR